MSAALWTTLPVAVLTEMFENARLAEGVQTLIDRVGISIEASA